MAKKKSTKLKRKVSPEEQYLSLLINVSERCITDQGTSIDELFTQQAARLRKRLEDLKK